jgi:hypothetical protein
MRAILILLAAAALTLLCFAADPVARKPIGTTKMFISSRGGMVVAPNEEIFLVYSNSVRVFDADMYMECDLLRLLQQTNRPARPTPGVLTNLNTQADIIIAEGNMMVMAQGTTLLGDRAVYTMSNETIIVTGPLVVIERSNLLFFATNFVFNRLTSSGYAVGETWTEVELSGSALGTNAPKAGFEPRLRPTPAPGPPREGNAK